MIDVDFDRTKHKIILDKIKKTASNINNMKPIWKQFEEYLKQDYYPKMWATKGKIYGEKWKDYTANYAKRKGYKTADLKVTGKLHEKVLNFKSKMDKKKMVIQISGLPYMAVHQFGYKKRNIPARPYFFDREGKLSAGAMQRLLNLMSIHIRGKWRK